METLKLIDFDEVKDMALGKVGTPSRDEYEREYSEWKRREDEERAIQARLKEAKGYLSASEISILEKASKALAGFLVYSNLSLQTTNKNTH